jgi:Flp pilus assembly protein TadG
LQVVSTLIRTPDARKALKDEGGQTMVELALLLPIFLLVLMGILWFGRAMNYAQDETHLANEAARFAAVNVNPGPGGSLQGAIRGQADSTELQNGSTMCVSFPNGTSNIGDPVKVTMSTSYSWIPMLGVGPSSTITGSAVMRLEAVPTNYGAGCA